MPETPAAPRPTRRSLMQGGLAVLATLPLVGCGPPSMPTYRYRLKVEVDTPQGLRTGSSVIEVTNRLALNINGGGYSFLSRARGEAVAVDLPGGQTLFALLRDTGWIGNDWAARVLYNIKPHSRISKAKHRDFRVDHLRSVVDDRTELALPPTLDSGTIIVQPRPMLVAFGNLQNPASVTQVNPIALDDTFGHGFRLHRISVQITDERVTKDIERRLPWLPNYYDRMLDGSWTNNSVALANSLSMNDFIRT